MIDPPRSTSEQLDTNRMEATGLFRRERLEEPLEDYLEAFDEYQSTVEGLLATTFDLTELETTALDILTDPDLLHAFRYLSGPPISDDDLKTLAEASSLSAAQLNRDPEMVRRIVQVVLTGIDQRRFPWLQEQRDATEAERSAAVLASAVLMAAARVGTKRRTEGKRNQEGRVEGVLLGAGLGKVAGRTIWTSAQAPEALS